MTSRARDTLYWLSPGFVDGGVAWFCPYAAQVAGFLSFYPEARATLDLVEIDFPRPRAALVALLGEAHQATPMLILADDAVVDAGLDVKVGEANGHRFIGKTIEILRYLAHSRGVPGPH